MPERSRAGRGASPGIAIGPLARPAARAVAGGGADAGDPAARLGAALAWARAELAALAARQADLGAEILEVQLELLDDPELAEPAYAALSQGVPVLQAWRDAVAAQVEAYSAADDAFFRARAADFADLGQRVAAALDGTAPAADATDLPAGAILLARDLTPSGFLGLDPKTLGGVALEAGSPASHVAVLARARGVPLVTGLGEVGAAEGTAAALDGEAGRLVLEPEPATLERYRRLRASLAEAAPDGPAVTRGGERVEVMVNVDDPAAVADGALAASDGVGLLRTEFLFLGRDRPPGEDEQHAALVGLLDRLGGRPCVARTLDVGGDKPLPGVTMPKEANPFLGLRGLRLCLERPDLFRPQARALLRAAVGRPLRVMLPMVATAGEVAEARAVFGEALAELRREGVPAAMPPLGVMVETPAAAVAVDLLDAADFYSIGTNDLTQYVMAAARDAGGRRVAALLDPLHPAVLRLVEGVVRHGARSGKPVSLCGDVASEPAAVGRLLDLGLRRLSVAPAALGRVKRAVADHGPAREGSPP